MRPHFDEWRTRSRANFTENKNGQLESNYSTLIVMSCRSTVSDSSTTRKIGRRSAQLHSDGHIQVANRSNMNCTLSCINRPGNTRD
jgi:hypothetical protein